MGGVATKLIEKNTTIPASKSQIFSTAADNQTSTEIHVILGERSMAVDNKTLGRLILDGIPPAPRGVPQIEVSFDIDANGILNVKAVDKASGKEQSIKIEATSGLSEDEIERMKQEAEKHSDEDRKKKELVDVKNLAEQVAYTAEKSLKDAGDKVPKDTTDSINAKIEALKKSKDGSDLEQIKSDTEALSSEMQKIGQHLNQQKQSADQPKDTEEGNVQDAEIVDDKDEEDNK